MLQAMFNKLMGTISGVITPFLILPIRSLAAYYVMDEYLQENEYGISRFILTPLLGTVSCFFTFVRSICCIPGDMYDCVKTGYKVGITGVFSVPFHFTTNIS